MKKKLIYLLYFFCGIITAIPCVAEKLWILAWISPCIPLFYELTKENEAKHSYRKAWMRGFSFFYAYSLVVFYWFVELYPLDFAGLTRPAAIAVIIAAWFGLPLLQAVPSAFLFTVLAFFKKRNTPLSLMPFIYASIWASIEWIETLTWAGVPWGRLALGQVYKLEIVQSASLLGSYFIAFIIILTAGFLTLSCIGLNNKSKRFSAISLTVAIVIFATNYIYGNIRLINDTKGGQTVTVSAVQPNISSDDKWSDDIAYTLTTYEELTKEAAESGSELIIWPESALPYTLNSEEFLAKYVERVSNEINCPLIIGTFYRHNGDLYNVTQYIEEVSDLYSQLYAKRRLVPFGEFVPYRELVAKIYPPLHDLSILSEDMYPGDGTYVFDTAIGKVCSAICFDSIYESLIRESVYDGAELITISTNDSWFHDSSAVYQHNKHAVLRSIENGRYTVRSANTGISSIITDKGIITAYLPPLTQGVVTGEVKLIKDNTLYTNIGNLIVWLSFAFIGLTASNCIIKDIKNGHTDRQSKKRQDH